MLGHNRLYNSPFVSGFYCREWDLGFLVEETVLKLQEPFLKRKHIRNRFLERITDCQMDAHAVFEVRNIVIAFLPRIVRYVQADSPIQADNEEGQVVA